MNRSVRVPLLLLLYTTGLIAVDPNSPQPRNTTTTTASLGSEKECQDESWMKYKDHCYKAFNAQDPIIGPTYGLNFPDSRKFCQSATGGDLVSLGDAEETAEVMLMMTYHYESAYWIGLENDPKDEGSGYYWVDGTPLDYTNWAEGEPDNQFGVENCGDLDQYMGWSWNDLDGENNIQGFVCEVLAGVPKPTTQPPTSPAPTTTTSIGPEHECQGETWMKYKGHCYKAFDAADPIIGPTYGLNFPDSRKFCQSATGGDLVSLRDDEEAGEVMLMMMTYHYESAYWIGLEKDLEDEGLGYYWVDGTPLNYTNWTEGEPDNQNGVENCGAVDQYQGWSWNDLDGENNIQGFVCEVLAGVPKPTTQTPTTTTFPGSQHNEA